MFVISQFVLHKSNMCKFDNISTYAIASGLIVYASIYLYLLFYNNDYVSLFNKFIIYIIGIDLLLSTFYYFNTSKKQQPQTYDLNFEQIPNVELLNISNDVNINSDDDESISNDEESDFEVETEDCEMEQINNTEQNNNTEQETVAGQETLDENINTDQFQTVDTEQLQETLEKINSEQLQETLEKINSEQLPQQIEQPVQLDEPTQINLSETKSLDLESEQVVKKRRGRKPNHLKKMQIGS